MLDAAALPCDHVANQGRPPVSRRYSKAFAELTGRFRGESLDVSFRELVGPLPANEYTHGIFPYPARLLRHIPRFLLATDAVVDEVDFVLDPFAGSGTVLLEAQLRGLESIGIEQNPVAALVSRVKTYGGETSDLLEWFKDTSKFARRLRRPLIPSPTLGNWYSPQALSVLGRLARVIEESPAERRDPLRLCLAKTSRRLATTDARIPVPVRSQRNAQVSAAEAWRAWDVEATTLASRLDELPRARPSATVMLGDARDSALWPATDEARRTLLLSSPPYGAAQKYVRSTSLEAGWLGWAPGGRTIHMERSSIGREHLSAPDRSLTLDGIRSAALRDVLRRIHALSEQRGLIYANYFYDMQRVFENAAVQGVRRIALVTGTNSVCGETLHTHRHLAEMVEAFGYARLLSLRDPIRGRSLLTIRKNGSQPSPAEYIDVFEVLDA